MPSLKDKVNEFAEIAKTLPENLQATCFELLLRHHLEGGKQQVAETAKATAAEAKPAPKTEVIALPNAESQHDLKTTDLHLKAKKFLEKYGLSLDQLNNLFFKENEEIKTLYEDLKTTKTSENQIRITLLIALRNAIKTGNFEANIDSVREECTQRKSYDSGNFNANYKNNIAAFDFDKFDKDTKTVRLSEEGRKRLAQVVQELQ